MDKEEKKNSGSVEEIIEELGLGGLSSEKKEILTSEIRGALEEKVYTKTLERLGEGDADELESLITSDSDPEEVEKFLKEKIEDYEELVQESFSELKKEILENVQ